ncbi:MAG: hypothetical protein JRF41_11720 [Deltaproteobacteria bacterium]|nr:hypothetical protein [Deltaproteobacteria bacterium]
MSGLNRILLLLSRLCIVLVVVCFPAKLSFSFTSLGPANYPTSSTPVFISDGSGCTNQNVVTGITITDTSVNGWTLTLTSTNGTSTQPRLKNPVNNSFIDYDLEINNISGTLGAGLTQNPPANTTLVFSGNSTVISPTGMASGWTIFYRFDFRMTISDASTVGKLAGTYTDTLNLVLASDD